MARNEIDEVDQIFKARFNELEVSYNPAHWQELSKALNTPVWNDAGDAEYPLRSGHSVKKYLQWMAGLSVIVVVVTLILVYLNHKEVKSNKKLIRDLEISKEQKQERIVNEPSFPSNLPRKNELSSPVLAPNFKEVINESNAKDTTVIETQEEGADSLNNFIFW